ncbi:MAG: nuclear transport factor 2 family protein [Acidobacteria bacterium]|nr:nuclear transport factor 2 family protein [Acidobacteriota bacterium]
MPASAAANHTALGIIVCVAMWIGSTNPALAQSKRERDAVIESLANAERAFARRSVEIGMQPSFLEYFAPDGINFTPHPVNTRQALSQRLLPASKPPITLNWAPIFADVSAAGDLGYTTGPYLLTDDQDGSVRSQGFYFSVWKMQSDGRWRVAVDFGIETPAFADNSLARSFVPAQSPPARTPPGPWNESAGKLDLVFNMRVTRGTLVKAYQAYCCDDETRLLRGGQFPLIGTLAIENYLVTQPLFSKLALIGSGEAASHDLGYSYGSWESGTGENAKRGYYLRVWKFTTKGWRLVAEVMNPLPPDAK